jgi:hypothetical protein
VFHGIFLFCYRAIEWKWDDVYVTIQLCSVIADYEKAHKKHMKDIRITNCLDILCMQTKIL